VNGPLDTTPSSPCTELHPDVAATASVVARIVARSKKKETASADLSAAA
jgi:hypothetical protein